MKHKLLVAVAATALMALPTLASADDQGWYVRGNVGYGTFDNMSISGGLSGDVQGESSVAGSLGLGYEFGNNWRLELDGSQLWNDLGGLDNLPSSYAKMRTNAVMLNALYDFNGFSETWAPYIGAGIGLAQSTLNAQAHNNAAHNLTVNTPACVNATCGIRDTDHRMAWQLIAGLGYDVTDRLVWDTQYRYLDLGSLNYLGGSGNAGHFNTAVSGAKAHTLMTGIRYKFGAYAPKKATPPVPMPEPVSYETCWDGSQVESLTNCPARTKTCSDGSVVDVNSSCPVIQREVLTCSDGATLVYDMASCPVVQTYEQKLCANDYRQEIIYYDFDIPQSAETAAKVQSILDTGKYCSVNNINVIGHTDTSGTAAYNLALSKRRASDVRNELIKQGVSSDLITSEGKGETQLFIDSGNDVKEPLNRRTEVLIRLNETGVVN